MEQCQILQSLLVRLTDHLGRNDVNTSRPWHAGGRLRAAETFGCIFDQKFTVAFLASQQG
jgi:hypothetical protein